MEKIVHKVRSEEKISLTEEAYFKSSNQLVSKLGDEVDLEFEKLLIDGNKKHAYVPFRTKNIYSKNDFEVLELLGKGAYAKVVKAKCLKDNNFKSIKIIDKHFMERVGIVFIFKITKGK
jgi:hypothetical protein